MPDDSSGPVNYFPGNQAGPQRYTNPFYGIPLQYLPLNVDQMLWWADHFLLRFGFYRAAITRIANYFITTLNIECDDQEAKEKYRDIFEDLRWKEVLGMSGMNLIAYGNTYLTINQGFNRFLICEKCKKVTLIERMGDYKFDKDSNFKATCKQCKTNGPHRCTDKPSKDIERMNVIFWNPKEIKVRHEEATGKSEFFWDYPQAYVQKVTKPDNKFFSKYTPMVIFDAIHDKKLLAFNPHNFLHLKLSTPAGIRTDGRAIPPSIYMFDDFFMLQVLRRFNEVICFEDINPFRVFAMAEGGNSQANPVLNQNSKVWQAEINKLVNDHRRDPGNYHTFPFPVNYQQLGGQGKNLAPAELIAAAIQNILNALNIPQEFYSMSMSTPQSIGPALRLFENSWSCIPDSYNTLVNHWADVIGKVTGLPRATVSLVPTTLSDDMEKKSIIGQLVSANAIAKSELLNLYGFDFKEQIRARLEEDRTAKEIQQEEQDKDALGESSKSRLTGGGSPQGGGQTPQDVLAQAQDTAKQLFPLDGAQRREKLQQIKAQDASMYAHVKAALEQLTAEAKSGGVQQAKQQPQQ